MSPNVALQGIMPAVVSPCDENDRFLEDNFAEIVCHLYQEGVDGLYVCGASGDGHNMRLHERKRAVEIAVQQSRAFDGTVIAHVGTSNSRDSIELAEHAAEAGAYSVSSMPPANRNFRQLVSYYTDIARASQLPLLIYYIPLLTGQRLSLGEMAQLLDIDGVVGLKFSDYNLFLMRRLILAHPGMVVFNGNDEMLCPALQYGASGGIGQTYNLFPGLFVAMYRAVRDGDMARAMDLQNHVCSFLDMAFHYDMFAVVEHFMRARGFAPYVYRRPRRELNTANVDALERELAAHEAMIDEACREYAGVSEEYGPGGTVIVRP